jgi:PHD/YefM family antitoxin component YafN of YafNO toxin-antitoxin module
MNFVQVPFRADHTPLAIRLANVLNADPQEAKNLEAFLDSTQETKEILSDPEFMGHLKKSLQQAIKGETMGIEEVLMRIDPEAAKAMVDQTPGRLIVSRATSSMLGTPTIADLILTHCAGRKVTAPKAVMIIRKAGFVVKPSSVSAMLSTMCAKKRIQCILQPPTGHFVYRIPNLGVTQPPLPLQD